MNIYDLWDKSILKICKFDKGSVENVSVWLREGPFYMLKREELLPHFGNNV